MNEDFELNKISVSTDVYMYIFTGKIAKHQDAVTVIVQDGSALIIDTAFPTYAEQVKKDLQMQGIEPKAVIFSHYHADHTAGGTVFSQCNIYAHEFYELNYNNCLLWEPQYTFIRPKHILRGGDRFIFGQFNLEFIHAPGHSNDSLITRITDKIIHPGDLIMMTKDKKASLPFIADSGDFQSYIASLERLKKLDPDIILLPHGGVIENKDDIIKMIDDRVYYLENTQASFGTLPLPACLRNDISEYDYLEFHDTNLMRLL
ncbi:MAG: MBL fold metallo-hydrolase [Acidobacteria bacterium]|jgi:glyoxylase-like metal-dependent hydrolase (beta-lactamase superfamily II)|nr:MBL fold metallo-hydrolase [Acidobacteriota bacterium]